MAQAEVTKRIGYSRARLVVLIVGLAILALVSGVMYYRGAVKEEVWAIVLFIPIFVAFVFGGIWGGLASALLASFIYVGLRWEFIQVRGFEEIAGRVATVSLGYFVFGAVGGWANRQLQGSLTKLELYDLIDDSTGLFNARFFVQDTDLEMSRSQRYRTLFSVAWLEFDIAVMEPLTRRQKSGLLKEVGRLLRDSVRNVDRAVHGRSGKGHTIAIVLPETGKEGAQIFADKLSERLTEYFSGRGVDITGKVSANAATFPGDDEELAKLRSHFAEIDSSEHPEEAPPAPKPDQD